MAGRTQGNGFGNMELAFVLAGAVILAWMMWSLTKGWQNEASLVGGSATTSTLQGRAREPAVAGAFYPGDKNTLSEDIDGFLAKAPEYPDVWGVRGLISPHAGYVYSGPVAAYGYRQLMKSRYETVIILGISHRTYVDGAYIPDVENFKTPLGLVPVSEKAKEMLEEGGIFTSQPAGADSQEHSVEVQVPFLQKVLPPFKVVPIMVGDADPVKLADQLMKYVDEDTLVVASTDLSHYKPYGECVATDDRTIKSILSQDAARMASAGDACGKIPVLTLMEIGKRKGWRPRLFDYRNSGDTAGDKSQGVVGYASIGFYDGLNQEEEKRLIAIAKETLVRHYRGEEMSVDESTLPAKLLEEKGCFVTLNRGKQLRGCIGHLTPQMKLYRCVIDNALNAALNDGRFNPVEASELSDIKIEISVLTTPRPLRYESPDDLKAKLIPGVDGVILKSGWRESTYLPVVWDMISDKQEFLEELCLKQGSGKDCWKTADVMTYQAQEFHEEGFK